jgi:hypothetical protein
MAITSNIQSGGTDIGTFYAPLANGGSLGTTAQAAVSNIQSAGADLNTLFANVGSGTARAVNPNISGTPGPANISTFFANITTAAYTFNGPASGVFTLPTLPTGGAGNMFILLAGSGGGGGGGFSTAGKCTILKNGGGGGGGGTVWGRYAISDTNNGQTFGYNIGGPGARGNFVANNSAGTAGIVGTTSNVIQNGTFTLTTANLIAIGGGGGGGAPNSAANGTSGAGGTASGGPAGANGNITGTTATANSVTGGAGATSNTVLTFNVSAANITAASGGTGGTGASNGTASTTGTSANGAGYMRVIFQM